jgi:hypothetical protein
LRVRVVQHDPHAAGQLVGRQPGGILAVHNDPALERAADHARREAGQH